jgi:hypothetical protein
MVIKSVCFSLLRTAQLGTPAPLSSQLPGPPDLLVVESSHVPLVVQLGHVGFLLPPCKLVAQRLPIDLCEDGLLTQRMHFCLVELFVSALFNPEVKNALERLFRVSKYGFVQGTQVRELVLGEPV